MAPRPAPGSARKLRRPPLPSFLERGLSAAAHFAVMGWDGALRDVRRTQEQQLLSAVRHARGTEFGRAHGFGQIRSYEDFRELVPVGDYDSFSPYIERMRANERNLLVPERVKYFANSSGSSNKGKSKYLPVTERQISLQRATAADVLSRYVVQRGGADAMLGYALGLFPPITMKREGDVFVTSNPALMMARMPAVGRLVTLPDRETMKIGDYEQKLAVIAEKFVDHDVRIISGTTCWFSLLFDKLLAAARRQGRQADTVSDLWPNLELLVGGGVAAGPYESVIRERIGHDRFRLVDTFNATEGGLYAATDFRGGRGMLMIPHRGTFFEFVPVEELGAARPRRVPLWDVEVDRLYAIVVTTVSGLYAYLLGDLVRFPSTFPLRIEFAGRLSGCLSTTQELTTHVEIQTAFDDALAASPALAVDYTAGADVGVAGTAKARYVLFAEFAPGREPADAAAFARAFDASLQRQNRVYREHRAGEIAIFPPEFVVLPPGSVQRFMAEIGNTSVQSKFPRIVDDERRERLRRYGGSSVLAS